MFDTKDRNEKPLDGIEGASITPPPDATTLEKSQVTTSLDIAPTHFDKLCYHREKQVTQEMNEYFTQHWPFPDEKSRLKFINAGYFNLVCWYCPFSMDDRIQFACRFLALGFLNDDALEHMSIADGQAYNGKLMDIIRGDVLPDPTIPAEYLMHDLWKEMRAQDRELADEIMEPTFEFLRAQVTEKRLQKMDIKEYLEYRQDDIGMSHLAALCRFCMGLKLTPEELAMTAPATENCGRHILTLNDIYSYDKEALANKTGHEEGSVLCNAVSILADGTKIPITGAKRLLYALCREWEGVHEELGAGILAKRDTPQLRSYIKTLEYQMSGNEVWSIITPRYNLNKTELSGDTLI